MRYYSETVPYFALCFKPLIPSQWVFGAKMTSYQRRCDVMTSHRRYYDVILRHVPAGFDGIKHY